MLIMSACTGNTGRLRALRRTVLGRVIFSFRSRAAWQGIGALALLQELGISDNPNAPLKLLELIKKGEHRRLEGGDALTRHSNRTERKQRPR